MATAPDSELRVLVVDDSSIVRQIVSTVVDQEPGMTVVGVASDGREALAAVERYDPDVIVLDLEMPVLGGMEAMRLLRERRKGINVAVFSNVATTPPVLAGLRPDEAVFVNKPQGATSIDQAVAMVRTSLIPALRRLALTTPPAPPSHPAKRRPTPSPPSRPQAQRELTPVTCAPIEIVMIGSSTGGPHALEEVIPRLDGLPVPIVVVQHISAEFSHRLSERLNSLSGLNVVESRPGVRLGAGNVHVAKGDVHLKVKRSGVDVVLAHDDGPPVNSCRPSVDVLFSSVVEIYGRRALAVVLTGMGSDGLVGARELHRAGGPVIVQDEPSSVVWGMPGSIAEAGLADETVPLPAIANRIDRWVSGSRHRAAA